MKKNIIQAITSSLFSSKMPLEKLRENQAEVNTFLFSFMEEINKIENDFFKLDHKKMVEPMRAFLKKAEIFQFQDVIFFNLKNASYFSDGSPPIDIMLYTEKLTAKDTHFYIRVSIKTIQGLSWDTKTIFVDFLKEFQKGNLNNYYRLFLEKQTKKYLESCKQQIRYIESLGLDS